MYALLGTRDNSARNVLLVTKEIRQDWGLLAPVSPVTAKGEGPVIQTQVSQVTPGPGVSGLRRRSGSPIEARAEEEISYLNSLRGWRKNGEHGAEVKGDRHEDSTLDLFHYGNAIGL